MQLIRHLLLIFFTSFQIAFGASAGFNNDASDAWSLANSNAVVARTSSAAANWFNPAALRKIDQKAISLSGMIQSFDVSIDSTTGSQVENEDEIFVIPSLFYAANQGAWSWGIGINSPYGLASKYNDPITDFVVTEAELTTIFVNPNIAYSFRENLHVSFGISAVFGDGKLSRDINQAAINNAASPNATTTFEGDDELFIPNFGLLYEMENDWTFGLNYRLGGDLKLKGDAQLKNLSGTMAAIFGGSEYNVEGSMEVALPTTLAFGVAKKVNEKYSIEVDIEWAQWSQLKEFRTEFENENDPTRLAILNIGNPQRKDWKDTWNFSLGMEYELSSKWSLSAGTRYRPSPIPDDTADPIVAPNDLIDLELGFSYINKQSRWDFVMANAWGLDKDIDNEVGNVFGASVDGDYGFHAIVIGASYSYQFLK